MYKRNGIIRTVSTIILPCNPIALVERLDIPMASKAAGNTGVRNELVSVCDELIRQNKIDKINTKYYCCNYKLLITKRNYKKKYVIGVAGILDSIGIFSARMFSSNVAKQLASGALQDGKTAQKISE